MIEVPQGLASARHGAWFFLMQPQQLFVYCVIAILSFGLVHIVLQSQVKRDENQWEAMHDKLERFLESYQDQRSADQDEKMELQNIITKLQQALENFSSLNENSISQSSKIQVDMLRATLEELTAADGAAFAAVAAKAITDKVTTHQYQYAYQKYLSKYRSKPFNMLEIGLG